MRIHYKFFLLLAISALTVLSGCREEEDLNLLTYPDNNFTLAAAEEEGGSEITVNATYNSDGILEFDKATTFSFRFDASPEETIVTFEPIGADVELSDTQLIIPAGYTDANITLNIKDMEAFQANYDEATCNLGVKATVQGYKMPSTTLEAKAVIQKEAYVATAFLEGDAEGKTIFDHAYFDGEFKYSEPNRYTFSIQLDRPVRKDIKVKLITSGLDEEYLKDITLTPSEIIIPAGEKTSGDITWEITNDFLLRTSDDSFNELDIEAVLECEDPVLVQDESRSSFTLNINKTIKAFEYVSYRRPSGWTEWPKQGFSIEVEDSNDYWQNDGGSSLLDGSNRSYGIGSDGDIAFTLDMGEEKTVSGIGLDYRYYVAPQYVQLSVSSDGNTWKYMGKVGTADENAEYYRFIEPTTARYIKYNLLSSWGCELYEIYVFK